MKRSEVLGLIVNQLDFVNGVFDGVKDKFTLEELKHADVILTTIEDAGMLPPEIDNPAWDSASTTSILYDNVPMVINKWERE